MLEKLLEIDRDVFVFLNSLGSESFDPFWEFITRQVSWIPVFAIIMVAVLIALTDQTTNLIKNTIQRLRPVNTPEIAGFIRAVQHRSSFSFVSGHASTSMAVTIFLFRVLRPYLKYMWLFFIWPLVFAYSRIYLGLHYPGDILMGYLLGVITSFMVLKLYIYLRDRYFPQKENLDNPTNSEPVSNG